MGSGARIWSLITAYLTLILSFIGLVHGFFALVELSVSKGEKDHVTTSSLSSKDSTEKDYLETIAFKSTIFFIMTALNGFIHGIDLCVGVYLRKSEHLTIWLAMLIPLLVFTGISLMLGMWQLVEWFRYFVL